MPALKNVRNELFCQLIVKSPKSGWPQGRCYVEAGYRTNGRSADACAARMLTRANIRTRIDELLQPTIKKTRATIDDLAEQLDEVFAGARTDRQWNAAASASGLKAKLLGFLREKIEVSGSSEFDSVTTTEDVVRLMLRDQSAASCTLASARSWSARPAKQRSPWLLLRLRCQGRAMKPRCHCGCSGRNIAPADLSQTTQCGMFFLILNCNGFKLPKLIIPK
jgi:hypothetical protein